MQQYRCVSSYIKGPLAADGRGDSLQREHYTQRESSLRHRPGITIKSRVVHGWEDQAEVHAQFEPMRTSTVFVLLV